jgi:hypothetical protein
MEVQCRIHNIPCPEPNQCISLRSIRIWLSHLRLGLSRGLLPEGLPVKILKALLPSFNQAKCPAHLLDLINLYSTNYT